MKTYGRHTVYANYTEEQLLTGTQEQRDNKVLDILQNSIMIHIQNAIETIYLRDYYYGKQDVYNKEKKTRTDINNKSVENWAYAFGEWKKSYLLGNPIKYAPLNNTGNEEISILNKYNIYEGKKKKDKDIYEHIYYGGRGFRFNNYSKVTDDDEAPFDTINLDNINTEVVYSSSFKHEQLLSYIQTSKKYIAQEIDPITGQSSDVDRFYDEYTVYTRDMVYTINNKSGDFQITQRADLIYNEHLITEYYMNEQREGFMEICKDIFDDINYVESLDKDDIEAFVNSIMVFTNAEVDEESMAGIKEFGAVSIKSTEQKKASVELLQSRLKSLDTQIYYLRKLSALHSILAVPEATQSGDFSSADTGKGMLVGQGFTYASVRVLNEQSAFEQCDRNALKTILKICRNASDSEIHNLKISDIDIKFDIDNTDNMLSKSQTLLNLQTANIPPEVANAVVGLFSDPVAVTRLQEAYIQQKEKLQQAIFEQGGNDNNTNKINEQNNKIQDTQEMENQGQ